jgi:hypothetical protein
MTRASSRSMHACALRRRRHRSRAVGDQAVSARTRGDDLVEWPRRAAAADSPGRRGPALAVHRVAVSRRCQDARVSQQTRDFADGAGASHSDRFEREMAFVATGTGEDGTPETLGVVRAIRTTYKHGRRPAANRGVRSRCIQPRRISRTKEMNHDEAPVHTFLPRSDDDRS